ncbi:KAZRN-like protein [Mya arenaria]|uniref:KAZRN-like protein n=1 Tax=Mya arenaria TaxID=6604 RepID=A0ABY7F0E9_MYAAR|nr:KAZRN-like protein [Mya arenaria]
MVLIRKLLHDAQAKFRKMVEDNKQLAAKIDGSINAANQEVSALRAELEDTNKRLSELSGTEMSGKGSTDSAREKSDEENELKQLKEDNEKLEARVMSLTHELTELRNRKLYGTLEDKESELRDFIHTYEQRMRESDESIKQLVGEKDQCDREKWEIIQKARQAAEQAVYLQSQSEDREEHIAKLEAELIELRDQIANSQMYRMDCSSTPKSIDCHTPTSDDLPPYETPPPYGNDSSKEECFRVPTSTPKIPNKHDRHDSFTPLNQFLENNNTIQDNEKSTDDLDSSTEVKKKKRKSLSSSISKVFSRRKSRASLTIHNLTEDKENDELPAGTRITLLNPENYQEKLKIVDQLNSTHMSAWKANQVLAWLEIVLNMPMYGKRCATNIKSGKVLLGMSDSDLASALEIRNPMHRKKVRLAIEEQRNLTVGTCPKCSQLDHTWVAHKWLHDIGLPQFSPAFESNLVDGRMLSNLTRKDLEKHLNVHRKFHQSSILHSVQLLQKLGFDKEVLAQRRAACDATFTDPLEYADSLRESGVHGALIVLEPTFTADTLASCLNIPHSKLYIRRHLQTELESLVKPAREEIVLKRSTLGSRYSTLSANQSNKPRLSLRGSLGRAFGKKVKDELSKRSWDEIDSPKQKRTSAPIVIDDPDDIPDQIKELDEAIKQASS